MKALKRLTRYYLTLKPVEIKTALQCGELNEVNYDEKGHDSILSVVHETAKDLRNAGIMDEITMREFDALCLPPVKTYQAQKIRQIRLYRENRPCQLLPTFMSQTH